MAQTVLLVCHDDRAVELTPGAGSALARAGRAWAAALAGLPVAATALGAWTPAVVAAASTSAMDPSRIRAFISHSSQRS
jgi:hypothetical protein